MKINTVARTKLGVYSCPSLRIAENQEQGKDKRRIFCPGLLKQIFFFFLIDFFFYFLNFFLFLFFSDFPFLFFWIFLFYFFWIFHFFSPGLTLYCQSNSFSSFLPGLTLYSQSNSFSSFYLNLLSIASQISFRFLSGLTSNGQFFSFFIWAYL